jgi:hypothetical protein
MKINQTERVHFIMTIWIFVYHQRAEIAIGGTRRIKIEITKKQLNTKEYDC